MRKTLMESPLCDGEKSASLKAIFLCYIIALCFFLLPTTAYANSRYASIVMDMTTGKVLSQRHADKKLYPASLTKMMTLYLVFEALENGTLRKYQRLPVSRYAADQEPSSLRLKPGETIRVQDAILALVTKSANDVAVVVGEALGGSEPRFAALMTRKARQLGMRNTRFKNASGLYHKTQRSTARDMAKLSMALMRDYPQYYHYFKTKSFSYGGKTYRNHNKLMKAYDGMDGLKTGYLHKSGFNLAASVKRHGHRLVGIVFGGRTSNSRNAHMAALLDRAFARVRKDQDRLRVASAALPQRKPTFNAIGLVMRGAGGDRSYAIEEGDASDVETIALRPTQKETKMQKKDWMIQVGAFSSLSAGERALRRARTTLPTKIHKDATQSIVPLNTAQGTIFRARLTGLDKLAAVNACRLLRGSCLILSAAGR